MKHGDIYEEKLEINEVYDNDYNLQYNDKYDYSYQNEKFVKENANNAIIYKGNALLGLLCITFFTVLKAILFFIVARIILFVMVELFEAPIETVFFLAIIALVLGELFLVSLPYSLGAYTIVKTGVKVYGNSKTIYFKLYYYAIWIITIILGYLAYNEMNDSTLPDVDKINDLLSFFGWLSFSVSLNTTKKNMTFWSCPVCKRGYMMVKYDTQILKSYDRAEFETVGGEFKSSNYSSNGNYSTGYEPTRQEFKGIYNYTDYEVLYECKECGHEKSALLNHKERVL